MYKMSDGNVKAEKIFCHVDYFDACMHMKYRFVYALINILQFFVYFT